MPTASALEIVHDAPRTGRDPEFNRARELLAVERTKAGPHLEAAVAVADEIVRLRERFLRDKNANLKRGIAPTAQGVPSDGFQGRLEEELGLHHEQARRYLERADYVRRLRLAAAGKPVPYITGTGKNRKEETFEPDATAEKMARASLSAVIAGDLPPSRAWAGVVGEGKRREAQGGSKERKDADPGKQMVQAFRSLQKWVPQFGDLPLEDQALVAAVMRDAKIPEILEPIIEAISKLKPRARG